MRTIYIVLIIIFSTSYAYNQNTKATSKEDDQSKTKKELDKILEAPSIDSVAFDIPAEQKEEKAMEAEPIYAPAPKPAESASPVEVKSEPVPGAEIVIDNVPDPPKKNKNKSTSNNKNNQSDDNKKPKP